MPSLLISLLRHVASSRPRCPATLFTTQIPSAQRGDLRGVDVATQCKVSEGQTSERGGFRAHSAPFCFPRGLNLGASALAQLGVWTPSTKDVSVTHLILKLSSHSLCALCPPLSGKLSENWRVTVTTEDAGGVGTASHCLQGSQHKDTAGGCHGGGGMCSSSPNPPPPHRPSGAVGLSLGTSCGPLGDFKGSRAFQGGHRGRARRSHTGQLCPSVSGACP